MHVFIETVAYVALWTIALSLFGAGSYLVGAAVLALVFGPRSCCDVCGRPMEDTYCVECDRAASNDRFDAAFGFHIESFVDENI